MLAGDTIKIKNKITDFNGDLIEAVDSHDITIYNSLNNVMYSQSSVFWESPFFYFYYTIPTNPEPGKWKIIWKVTKTLLPSIKRATFDVEEIP